ncbi:UbiX family flavin prenyltransferase [Desulfoplanes formicivorans]|nr:UbiX family flavin prenyltransferase [Desulfoplanes formicivorans]
MPSSARPRCHVLAVTGASGMPYALRLAQVMGSDSLRELHVIVSQAARLVLETETKNGLALLTRYATAVWDEKDIGAPPASGSWRHNGMVVCPCSMASLGAIAHGLASNLIHRAADVSLKEKRPLILVPRETPFSRIHVQNMLTVMDAGATIIPPCPGFYARPQTIADLVDQVVGRILDHLGIDHGLTSPWTGV